MEREALAERLKGGDRRIAALLLSRRSFLMEREGFSRA
jgi:hypothetical protein